MLFICDPDDEAEQEAIAWERTRTTLRVNAVAPGGNYAFKVNYGVNLTREPLIFLGADDLHFHPGWLAAAIAKLSDGVGVVGTNDMCNPAVMAGEHATHFLVTREYAQRGTIDDLDKLLHEGYPHEWVDNEFIETAKARDAYAMALGAVVEHLHPLAGKAPSDELYAGAPERMAAGQAIFDKRRHLWA